jgi:surfactin synthase thioesterase subunit
MGALIAFEAIRELRRRCVPMPAQLFVGAMRAPQLPAAQPPLAQLPREAFLEHMRKRYDFPQAAWQNPDLLEIIRPVLRADMALCESYVYRREPPFEVPIQAFAGSRDGSAPVSAVQAWREQTTAEFAVEVFDGTHFFVNTSLAGMQQVMISRLQCLVRGATRS